MRYTIRFLTSKPGDWVGMYINGNLVTEGHSIAPGKALDALNDYMYKKDAAASVIITKSHYDEEDEFIVGTAPETFPASLAETEQLNETLNHDA